MIKLKYCRQVGESDDQLIYRVCKDKDLIGTWDDVANILNELLGTDFRESTFRKKYQSFQKMFEANQTEFYDSNQINEIKELTRELKREQVKFRDERNAWNKQNYIDARIEQKLDCLEYNLSELGKINFKPLINTNQEIEDSDLIVCLSDLHIGETFTNNFGEYNSSITRKRLEEYIENIIKIGFRHKSENIYIVGLGDFISGNIHLSLQVTNRENVIEQIKTASEYISNFAYELSKYFKNVYFTSVAGNHSRLISNKENDVKDERLDDLITWIVEKTTSHIDNIKVLHDNFDNTVSKIIVHGKNYVCVHGDYDSPTSNSVGKLCMMIGEFPYAILAGHKHTPMTNEFNGIKFIQSGSLSGSGDDFTVQKRLSGKPNQTVLVCNDSGIECIYNVELK